MAYVIESLEKTILVEKGTVNTETSLQLVGKDYFGYGEAVAQSFVSLLENFASAEPALSKRITGQLWYDDANETLKVWQHDKWSGTTLNQKTVKDITDTGNDVFVVESGGVPIALFSNHEFVMHASEPYIGSFPADTVRAGVTLANDLKFYGTATAAEYADLAELYSSDADYEPGTVVKIGGEAEVTQTTVSFCSEVFGIVSTNPAYLMNSTLEGMSVPVALEGRVPCKVVGQVKKGQRLVSSEVPGVARAVTDYEKAEGLDWFKIVGRALADKDTLSIGLVEVIVGAK